MVLNPFNHPICFATPERLVASAWHEHVPFAMFLVDILKPEMIVELGTHHGESYCAFCQAVKRLNLDTRCYAIDTWEGDAHAGFYGPEVLADLRAYHDLRYGNFSSLIQSTFDQALNHFADGTISLLHIDGCHEYEAVKRDFDSWLPKMRRDGVVLLHDSNVRERDFGIRQFWDEIKSTYRHFEFMHGHGLVVLAVGDIKSSEFQELLDARDNKAAIIREFFFQLGNRLELTFESMSKSLALEEQADRLREQQDMLSSFDAELERQSGLTTEPRLSLASLLEELDLKRETLRTLSADSAEKTRVLESIESQLAEKEQTISALSMREAEHKGAAQLLSAQLADTQQLLDELRNRVVEKDQAILSLTSQIEEKEGAIRSLSMHLSLERQAVQTLSSQVAQRETQLENITNTMGWRLLSIYGRRVKYPYLLPLYSKYGRIKYRYLLPVYRLLGLMPKESKNLNPGREHHGNIAPSQHQATPVPWDVFPVTEVTAPAPLQTHRVSADIIVCVHDALDDVKRCLESIIRYTRMPYSLILVDDGSNKETRDHLAHFASAQRATLTRNERAKGYTFAANQGLQESKADYVVLLNSDTVVTKDWLDRMISCGESDPRIGLVGPLSNSASWQSVPEVISNGDWAGNELPEGWTAVDMGKLVGRYSDRLYPRIPFLNGFCLMIKRRVIEEVGYFDEVGFGRGYGEENDYCLRARKAGWELAIAEDVYVYHYQSRSYSHDRRRKLSEHADVALAAKHGQQIITDLVEVCRSDRVLEGIRARSRLMVTRQQLIEQGKSLWEGKRVLFVLPIAEAGGGGNVIVVEAEAMRRMGVDARILNLTRNRARFERSYPENTLPVAFVDKEGDIPELLPNYDAVVATYCESVYWIESRASNGTSQAIGYYIQDFEPHFFREGSPEFRMAWDSYARYPELVRITKTEWNRSIVEENLGVHCNVVGPSVDIDLNRPRRRSGPDWPHRPLRIAVMIRPSTPRRAAKFTLEVLRELYRIKGGTIEIILFGSRTDEVCSLGVSNDFVWRNAGVLTRERMAFLLNEVDIFADFSSFQAMGLTAMEAMACGAAVLVPQNGGAKSFVTHEENGIIVDTSSGDACLAALNRLVTDKGLRTRIQRQALGDICQFFPERAAFNTLKALFQAGQSGKEC